MDAVDLEDPGGVLAGGTASEVFAGHDDSSVPELLPLGIETFELEVFEAVGLEGLLGDLSEVFGGYDLISIDIGPRITSYNVCYTKLLRLKLQINAAKNGICPSPVEWKTQEKEKRKAYAVEARTTLTIGPTGKRNNFV